MKRMIFAALVLSTLTAAEAFAGEKEELQLKQALLQERLSRLQAEYTVTTIQLKEIEAKLTTTHPKEPVIETNKEVRP